MGSIPDLRTKIPRAVGQLSPRITTREKPACHNKEPALLRQPKINKETNNKHLNIKRSLCRESETEWPLVIRGQSRGLCLAANDRKTPPNVVCISPLKVNSGEKGNCFKFTPFKRGYCSDHIVINVWLKHGSVKT